MISGQVGPLRGAEASPAQVERYRRVITDTLNYLAATQKVQSAFEDLMQQRVRKRLLFSPLVLSANLIFLLRSEVILDVESFPDLLW